MTRREWKRVIYGGLAVSLQGELANGSEWLFNDVRGEPLTPAEEARMRAAADEVIEECFRRREARPASKGATEGER